MRRRAGEIGRGAARAAVVALPDVAIVAGVGLVDAGVYLLLGLAAALVLLVVVCIWLAWRLAHAAIVAWGG